MSCIEKEKITKEDIIKSEVICPNCESNEYLTSYSRGNEEGKYVMCKKCRVYYDYNNLKQYKKRENTKFRNKPVIIDAWQMPLGAKELLEINSKTEKSVFVDDRSGKQIVVYEVENGALNAYDDDWIILTDDGKICNCKDSVFKATYEKV